jgi:hypothetical protein
MKFPIEPKNPQISVSLAPYETTLAEGISSAQANCQYTLDEVILFVRRKRAETSQTTLHQLRGREDY